MALKLGSTIVVVALHLIPLRRQVARQVRREVNTVTVNCNCTQSALDASLLLAIAELILVDHCQAFILFFLVFLYTMCMSSQCRSGRGGVIVAALIVAGLLGTPSWVIGGDP